MYGLKKRGLGMKIVITDADTVFDSEITADFLKKYGDVTLYGLTKPEELSKRISDADMVLCNKTNFGAEVLQNAAKLKYIGLFATGYNNIDIKTAAEKGITVCNAPGYSTEAVAQHTFAFILAMLNRVGEYNATVKQGDWIKSRTFSYFPFPIYELSNKTLGIVGFGAIGRRVAEIGKAFGMRVLVNNRHAVNDPSVKQVTFERLLAESDIVTLHCPLNEDSAGMMNKAAFERMKDGAVFVNTARGALVDETALRDALKSGKLLAAGVDVLCNEPMSKDCPLYGLENCCITPHIAWAGLETRRRLMGVVEENIKAFLGGNPINTVK